MSEEKQNQAVSVFNLQPKSLTEAIEYAKLMARSSLVPRGYCGKPQDILIAVQMGSELGLSPLQSLQSIAVINGRPTLWGDAVLGLVRDAGVLDETFGTGGVEELDPEECKRVGFGLCKIKRKGWTKALVRKFTREMAEKAGLYDRARGTKGDAKGVGPWITYEGRMLMFRARSWALRDACPDVLRGLRIREEEQDLVDATDYEVRPDMPRRASQVPKDEKEQTQVVEAFLSEGEASEKPEPPAEPDFPNPWIGKLTTIQSRDVRVGRKKEKVYYFHGGPKVIFESTDPGLVEIAKDLGKGATVEIVWERQGRRVLAKSIEPHIPEEEPAPEEDPGEGASGTGGNLFDGGGE